MFSSQFQTCIPFVHSWAEAPRSCLTMLLSGETIFLSLEKAISEKDYPSTSSHFPGRHDIQNILNIFGKARIKSRRASVYHMHV